MSTLWLVGSFIIPLVIMIGVIVIIVKVVVDRKNNGDTDSKNKALNEKAGEEMLKNIYVYSILFVTLMMSIGGSVGVFSGVADLVTSPQYIESYSDFKENTLNRYTNNNPSQAIPHDFEEFEAFSEKLEQEIKADYDIMVQERKNKHKDDAVRQIVMSLGWIIIPFPLFMYYQRQLKRKDE